MGTITQQYRDGIADWIDSRTSKGRDYVVSVMRTFIQRKGIDRRRFLERMTERTSFPAICLLLGKGFSPVSVWLIVRGDELLVWLGIGLSSGASWSVKEPLARLDLSHPDIFEHLSDRLRHFDVELPKYACEAAVQQDKSAEETGKKRQS